jgi:hypothetical protein
MHVYGHRLLAAGIAAAGLLAANAMWQQAGATEPGEGIQYPIGAGVGGAPGLAPPPGFSIFFGETYNTDKSTDANGNTTGVHSTNYATYAGLLFNPSFKILGADYYAGVSIADLDVTLNIPGVPNSTRTNGLTSLAIEPVGLSWALPYNLHGSAGLNIYAPVGQYGVYQNVDAGDNYWTFEPVFGLTYLKDDWNLSGDLLYDFNTTNSATNYTSGQSITIEFSGSKSFGKWSFGAGGYYWAQTTGDTNHGVPIDSQDYYALGGQYGVFPQGDDLAIGPFVGYNFGPISVIARALFDVYAHDANTPGTGLGSHVTLGFFLPL